MSNRKRKEKIEEEVRGGKKATLQGDVVVLGLDSDRVGEEFAYRELSPGVYSGPTFYPSFFRMYGTNSKKGKG